MHNMVRPRKFKHINYQPDVTYFKPRGVPLNQLEQVEITFDELETLRLSNIEKLSQSEAAEKMKIHQSTFQRTLTRAREKLTDSLVNGKAIKIHGGEYNMPGRDGTGPEGKGPQTGRGLGPCKEDEEGNIVKPDTPMGKGLGRGFRCGNGVRQ